MKRLLKHLDVIALALVPLVLAVFAFLGSSQTAILSLVVVFAALLMFFAHYEASKPALRQIMPTAVLSALAAAGRILFAAIPNFKPVTALCIISGVVFGKRAGFMVGALAALVSNFFFGQGPWTPWQMYAWGMVGYLAGVFASHGLFNKRAVIYIFGFFSALLYGFVLNTWFIIGFVNPITWQSVAIAYGASLVFDSIHGAATVAFLLIIFAPWQRKLERIKRKYELDGA